MKKARIFTKKQQVNVVELREPRFPSPDSIPGRDGKDRIGGFPLKAGTRNMLYTWPGMKEISF